MNLQLSVSENPFTKAINLRMIIVWRQYWQSFYSQILFMQPDVLSICLVLDRLCFAICRHKPVSNITVVQGTMRNYFDHLRKLS